MYMIQYFVGLVILLFYVRTTVDLLRKKSHQKIGATPDLLLVPVISTHTRQSNNLVAI